MKTMRGWLDAYGVNHQNSTNELIHWFCVPIIFFSVIGLLASIPHDILLNLFGGISVGLEPYVHFGTIVIILALVFYIRLSISMAIGILVWCLFCLWGNAQLEMIEPFGLVLWQVSLILFALGWIGQFIGHKIEGAKPSFLEDIQFLLIGPAWLMGFIYKKIGIKF